MALSDSKRRYWSLLPIALSAALLSACSEIIDTALDCIDDDQPEISPKTLADPVLNQVYEQTIHVGIRNEPWDDRFDYRFTLDGTLPEGIQTEAVGRDLMLMGTATQLGDYSFSITVTVEGGNKFGFTDGTDGLCSTVDKQSYEWTIQTL